MAAAASLGLTAFTGRAVVVILSGTRRVPRIVLRHEIDLADPWVPESRHPYHQELGDRNPEGVAACRRGCSAARRATRRAICRFVAEMRSHGHPPRAAAIVAASLVDPDGVAGAHARAHAEEGKLYREAIEAALQACGVPTSTFLQKALRALATQRLRTGAPAIEPTLKAFSHVVGTPWRAPEKLATLAAWISLTP